MKLLTPEIEKQLPALYSSEGVEDPPIIIKFFDPSGSWIWYVIEGARQEDGDMLFFGLVDGHEKELGYFTLSELQSSRGRFGLGIERDVHFKQQPISTFR